MPRRPAHVRKAGLFFQIVALIVVLVFPGSAITMGALLANHGFWGGDAALGWGGVVFIFSALVFAWFILGIFLAGWLMRAGRCEITVAQGQIRATERVRFLLLAQTG